MSILVLVIPQNKYSIFVITWDQGATQTNQSLLAFVSGSYII